MQPTVSKAAGSSDRITALDAIRGIAVCGILMMNAVSFGLSQEAYFNISADGMYRSLDWVIGVASEIFIDQKMMALFSMLFGASIVLFYDRAAASKHRPARLSLWRNFLLLLIGLVHGIFWIGDVLFIYALCAPALLLMMRLPVPILYFLGGLCAFGTALTAPMVQSLIPPDGSGLESIWIAGELPSGSVLAFVMQDFFGRALGYMLIGVALYRSGIITGQRSVTFYRRMAIAGLVIGLPIAAVGVAIQIQHGFDTSIALVGEIPNTIATLPVALAYMSGIVLWNQAGDKHHNTTDTNPWRIRVRALGKMALTNYLSQTVLGLLILGALFDNNSRTLIFAFVLLVWAAQLYWSERWLAYYRFGPVEWLWRCATNRRIEPNRREPATT
jgi:uncharacterized protein